MSRADHLIEGTKHTPGPWVADDVRVLRTGLPGEREVDRLVALVYSNTPGGLANNLDANARLIAAAPTTVEKAMAFTFIVERFMRGDLPQGVKAATETEVADALYELRNHIAKATGSAA